MWLNAALGGALLLRTVALTATMLLRGPLNYWYRLWVDPWSRTVYVTVAFALFAWSFVAIAVVLATAYGRRFRQALGAVLLGLGLPLVVLGALLSALGVERGLTALNDQMAILPMGLSRILGLTVHLGIPTALGGWLLSAGCAIALIGGVLAIGRGGRRRRRTRAGRRCTTPSSPGCRHGCPRARPGGRVEGAGTSGLLMVSPFNWSISK